MSSTPPVAIFKRGKKSRPTTSRKRSASPEASTSQVVLPTKKASTNLLSAGSKRTLSQREQDEQEEDNNGYDVKYTAAGSHSAVALEILAGDEAAELISKRRRQERLDKGLDSDSEVELDDDGNYHGQKSYKSHLKKTPQSEVPKAMRVGPQRASGSTIRTVTIVDYQPDVCKDYKETGYCGFGDTCKFLHDRGTYLAGWQLDNLAANPKKNAQDVSDSDDSDEDVPFACLICRNPYTDPIVTRCGHYFCSACAIKRYVKTPKCRACGTPTGGMFNRAEKIIEKREKKKEARKKKNAYAEDDEAQEGKLDIEIEGE